MGKVSHSSEETQGRGGFFSTSGHGLGWSTGDCCRYFGTREGTTLRKKWTLRIPSKSEDKLLGP